MLPTFSIPPQLNSGTKTWSDLSNGYGSPNKALEWGAMSHPTPQTTGARRPSPVGSRSSWREGPVTPQPSGAVTARSHAALRSGWSKQGNNRWAEYGSNWG